MRFRMVMVAAGLLLGFTVLLCRSAQLQLLQDCWSSLATSQIERSLRLEPLRGEIYDRNGEELAVSIEMESMAADPRVIQDPQKVAKKLAAATGMAPSTLAAKLKEPRAFVWLEHYVSPRQADAIKALHIRGVRFVRENRRYYPNGELAGHLLGFVGRDHHGLEGLEFSSDLLLRGRSDTQPVARDARGQIIYTHGLPEKDIPRGYSLGLTLDKRIQYIAEKELQKTVHDFDAKGGTVVVMEPATGEILAMAVFPSFNPNTFTSYQPAAWRNRVVTDAFEPGSIFKIFLAAASLEEGLVQPDDRFYCENGKYRIQNHTIHDLQKFGWLSLAEIIRFSSNIGAVKVGEKLGASRFHRYIKAFGFGAPTGIGLPGESSGLVRPPEEWSTVDLAAASFGQSISVTSLQLAMALGAVANDGLLMQPLLIKEVMDTQKRRVRVNKPRVIRRVISKDTARCLKDILADVLAPGGTGTRAALAHYRAAGKTGTGQKSSPGKGYTTDLYTASFIGFVPVHDPKIVVVIVINEPGQGKYGGVVAAPAFRRIARKTLHCLNITPDRVVQRRAVIADPQTRLQRTLELQPAAYAPGESDSLLMPDLSGLSLRTALNRLRALPCPIKVKGSGRVIGQSPKPGEDLSRVASCSLVLAAD